MVDLSIRKNEKCIVGLPHCGYAFNSTRSVFLAYGFSNSRFEQVILRNILEDRGMELVEASSASNPGQLVFCTKICSKIITSQFCIVLANNDEKDGVEFPNANVNMEYGLMLGHGKYVVPFQREDQKLPFNIAAMDTVKYNQDNFERLAEKSIDKSILDTKILDSQDSMGLTEEQYIDILIISMNYYMSDISNFGEKQLFDLGSIFDLKLAIYFDGDGWAYFGDFTLLNSEMIAWRILKLSELCNERFAEDRLKRHVEIGFLSPELADLTRVMFQRMRVWILLANDEQRETVIKLLEGRDLSLPVELFTTEEMREKAGTGLLTATSI